MDEFPQQSFTPKLVLTIALLFLFVVPGLLALAVFGKEARDAQAQTKRPIPGARELIFLNRYVFIIIAFVLILLVLAVAVPLIVS